MMDSNDNRSISIQKSAIGSTLISGNGNQVTIHQTDYRESLAAQSESTSTNSLGANPYKGLLAFQETDSDRYFGREREIHIIWQKLRSLYESESSQRLLPIYGPSGSGKSSLVRAGLIPELARRSLPGQDKAQVAVLVPGAHPLRSLARVLARAVTGDSVPVSKAREFEEELQRSNQEGDYDGLHRIASALPGITTSPLIVLVDQFEEAYSLSQKEEKRHAFVANLLYAAADRCRQVLVIVTLRSDFLEQTQQDSQLNQLFSSQGFLVPAMSKANLRIAIAEPAKRGGYKLDEATIQLLIEQTEGREGALPLLQFALAEIWQGLVAGVAPATKLEQMDGVGGALAGEAQRVYNELTEKQKICARRIFLGLVQLGEGTRDTRRRVQLDRLQAQQDDEADFRAVLNRFSAPGVRLITLAAASEGTDTAELTHEALFEHWPQLNDWLNQSRDDLRFQRRLQDAAQYWDNQVRPEGLLWRPPDLNLLKSFHQRASDEMTSLELEFFNASVEAIEQGDRARKRQRQRTIIGLTGGLVSALVLASIAGAGWWRASNAATNERIKALVLESQSLFGLSGRGYYSTKKDSAPSKDQPSTEQERNRKEEEDKKSETFFQEASLKAIEAGRELQHASGTETGTKYQVLAALQQIIGTKVEPKTIRLPECEFAKRGPFSLTWSSDKKTIACVNYDGTVRLWDSGTGKKINIFQGDSEWVNDVQFSLDGRTVASGTANGTVKLWERSTGKEIRSLKGHLSQVREISFSPDGQTIAAANYDSTITLWEVATGRELKTLSGYSNSGNSEITSIFFSPNGQFLISGGMNSPNYILKLWEVSTGKELKTFDLGEDQPSVIDFSSNSQTLVYSPGVFRSRSIHFWNISENREIKNMPLLGEPFLSPDGRIIAVIDEEGLDLNRGFTTTFDKGLVSFWDTSTGKKVRTISISPSVPAHVYFSPDGKLIAIYSYDGDNSVFGPHHDRMGKITFWTREGTKLSTIEQLGEFFNPTFSPDGQKIAVSSVGRAEDWHLILKLWNVSTGRLLKTLFDEPVEFSPAGLSAGLVPHFSPNGQMITVINSSGIANFFDSSTGAKLNFPNVSPSHDIDRPPIISRDGKFSVTLRTDASMRYQNRSTGEETKANRWDSVLVSAVHISDDDKTITTVNWYGKLQKRELATGQILNTIDLPFPKLASRLEFSPDGRRVAAAMSDNTVKIWDITTSKEITTLKGYASQADTAWIKDELHFSPDGTIVAALGSDYQGLYEKGGKLELWEASTGKPIQFTEIPSGVKSISFSHTSDELALLKTDNTIQLWKLSTRQLLKTIRPSLDRINGIQFNGDSKILFVFGLDELKMLDTETARETASFRLPPGSVVESVDFSGDGKTLVLKRAEDAEFTSLDFDLEDLLERSCNIARDYLKNHQNVNESDRHLCDFSTGH